jgi:membrane-associated phospholipid phosphatase
MIKKIVFPLVFLVLSQSAAIAQYRDTTLKYNFSQFWRETGHYFTTPLHWGGSDAIVIGSLVAGTGIAYALEAPAKDVIFKNRTLYNGTLAQMGDFYGGLYTPFIIFGAFGGYSLITGDMKARKIAYEIGQSCLYAGAITALLKYTVGRARPYANLGKSSFFNFSLSNDAYHSFPSGHMTEAMAMSTVLAFNSDPLWLKILCYAPVPFTFFSRAYQGFHWVSDCILGAGVGFFTAKWCADAHGRRDDAPTKLGDIQVKSLLPFTVSMALN